MRRYNGIIGDATVSYHVTVAVSKGLTFSSSPLLPRGSTAVSGFRMEDPVPELLLLPASPGIRSRIRWACERDRLPRSSQDSTE